MQDDGQSDPYMTVQINSETGLCSVGDIALIYPKTGTEISADKQELDAQKVTSKCMATRFHVHLLNRYLTSDSSFLCQCLALHFVYRLATENLV